MHIFLDFALMMPDVADYTERAATKPEVEIHFKQKEMATRFQWQYPHIFDDSRLRYRGMTWPTLPDVATKPKLEISSKSGMVETVGYSC